MLGNNFGNNNPNIFPPQPQMMQNPMMQQQQAMMQAMMQQQQAMMQAMMQQQMMMMQQQNVDNNQQNNSLQPQDDEGLSSSIATNIINVILGSSHTSCDGFQKALATKEITDRLNSDPSILTNYMNGLINVLQRISSNGATYKKMENGALRVFGGSDRVMDFMKDKIISYYAYGGGEEASSMRAFFEGKNYYKYNSQDIYFDLIKCEYDLNNKTYKIIITLQGTEKEVIFEGDDVSKITGVSSGAHGFNVVVNGVYVSMSNKIDEINENFKDKKLNITAKFFELNKENTAHANNNIDNQDKSYDNFNYEKTNSGCSCFNWCSDCLKSCKEKCFTHENEYVYLFSMFLVLSYVFCCC